MRNTCPSPFLVAVALSSCGPSKFTRKLQDMHLARHFGSGNTRKPDVILIINCFYRRTVEVTWNWTA